MWWKWAENEIPDEPRTWMYAGVKKGMMKWKFVLLVGVK